MGTCITVIKIIGASSLGLLSGTMALQKYKAVPDLLARLNKEESIHLASGSHLLSSIVSRVFVASGASVALASLASYLFSTAYKYSPLSAQHPYLVYCAIGGPVALAAYHYKSWGTEYRLGQRSKSYKAHVEKTEQPEGGATRDEDSHLGKSYIHVNSSLLGVSTPNSSAPGSPAHKAQEESAITQEVEDAMNKKTYAADLERLSGAYSAGAAVSLAAFGILVVGLVGDLFFV